METQTENTNVATQNQESEQQYIPLHKSYCRECGTMISAKAVSCPKCGATQNQATIKQDNPSVGLKVLSFFFPLIGLILFAIYSKDTPNSAKEYGKWALIGFLTGIIAVIMLNIILLTTVGSFLGSMY